MATQTSFNAGELTPQIYGKGDLAKYHNGCRTLRNLICLPHGPAARRPGLPYVASTKTASRKAVLIPFEFSTDQTYMLEFGHLYIRFYRNKSQIESSPGVPYEIASPYTEDDLEGLDIAQSADTLFIGSTAHWPRELVRFDHNNWTLSEVVFSPPPFLDVNTDPTILVTASAVTGVGITLTASSPIFTAAHVGSYFRIAELIEAKYDEWETGKGYAALFVVVSAGGVYKTTLGGTAGIRPPVHLTGTESDGAIDWEYLHPGWGYAKIVGFSSTTSVTANVVSRLPDSSLAGEHRWSEGAWSDERGHPGAVTIHQQRITWAKSPSFPERMWLSESGKYRDHAVSKPVVDSDALDLTLGTKKVNAIQWIESVGGLVVGTSEAEWRVSGSDGGALTANSKDTIPGSFSGSASIQPVGIGNTLLFVQRHGKIVRELIYAWESQSFSGEELTILAEHLTRDYGIVRMAFQRQPYKVLWCVREDGILLGLTYHKEHDVWGWHRHDTAGLVEDVSVINGIGQDEVWFINQRNINGADVRYMEVMADFFKADDTTDATFLDACKTHDGRYNSSDEIITISGITKANPAVVTTGVNHDLLDGDSIRIRYVEGMEDSNGDSLVNEFDFVVANKTPTTFELTGLDTSGATVYVKAGTVGKNDTVISGLDHLENEEVDILSDGAPVASQIVAGGSITLAKAASVVCVGLGYVSDLATLPVVRVGRDGRVLSGLLYRITNVILQLYKSLGVQVGSDEDSLSHIPFTDSSVPEGRPAPLFSGFSRDKGLKNNTFGREASILIRQDQPLPLTISSISYSTEEQDDD